jgi:uncharacterized zinc-type alcohol dehydrogenase-like protein
MTNATKIPAYAAQHAGAALGPSYIERREPGEHDVQIDILYCGVCHTDVHQVRDEWGGAQFPLVPGHEIVGRVVRVGAAVKKLAVGDLVGVGCMVDSCRECDRCRRDLEQFCARGPAFTYSSTEMDRRTPTYGGYSTSIVVAERFALRIPAGLDPAGAAPLLCAGITTYSPLVRWGVKAGDRVGVVGLGGLGHMGVKLAAAMGAEVTVFSTSRSKEADARRLGAHDFVATGEAAALKKLGGRFDLVIDTVSARHDVGALLGVLRPEGVVVLVGVAPEPLSIPAFALIDGNRRLVGSLIGGIAETQEMLDYCGARKIVSDVEVIPIQKINEAYDRIVTGDVRYRFSIDMSSLRA